MKKQIAIIGTEDEIKTATDILTHNYKKYIPNGEIKTFAGCPIKTNFIPETFEDLREMCKKYNGKGLFIGCCYIEVGGQLLYSNMVFTNDGAIFLNTDCIFAEKVSIPRMWQIIKSLMEEV